MGDWDFAALARLVYRMLNWREQCVDKRMKYHEEERRAHEIHTIQKKAQELGLESHSHLCPRISGVSKEISHGKYCCGAASQANRGW
jgi:hypothetical protein